jgi:undecaprenyl-diphosphatase
MSDERRHTRGRLLVALAALAASVVLLLGAALTPGSAVFRADHAVSHALHDRCPPWLASPVRGLTFFGNGEALAGFTIVGLGVLLRAGRRRDAGLFLFALAGGGVLNVALKLAYARARPSFEHPLATAHGFSFPSGHAMGTCLLAGMLVVLASREGPLQAHRAGVLGLALVWTLSMGLSRIVLGVHFPSDVLAGYAAGLGWLALSLVLIGGPARARA